MIKGNKMSENKALFIKTQDLKTAEGLNKAGFELVYYENSTWTFINNPDCPITFENNNIMYSNILNM